MKLLIAAFLTAHALIHVSYLTPAPPATASGPQWPFDLGGSWLVNGVGMDPNLVKPLGEALVVVTAALFLTAALATGGWLVPAGVWPAAVAGGAISSALLLGLFFHPWLVLGLAIDAALLWVTLVSGWQPIAIEP
jgi:hypothetical protein